jgi:Holliday junction DNA helicase RuvA
VIGWLSGVVRAKRPPHLLLEVNGVGYEVEAPMTTFYELPAAGERASLFTHQVVREDAHALFGFARERERDLFRLLIRVSGVGPKLALAVLSTLDAAAFGRCVLDGDGATLTRVPGVGKKTAERLIIEMRDRLDGLDLDRGRERPGLSDRSGPVAHGDARSEAVSALVALGFKPQEASQRVRAVAREGMACEEIIRGALQSAARP